MCLYRYCVAISHYVIMSLKARNEQKGRISMNPVKVKHLGDCHCELYDRPEGFSSIPLMCKRG